MRASRRCAVFFAGLAPVKESKLLRIANLTEAAADEAVRRESRPSVQHKQEEENPDVGSIKKKRRAKMSKHKHRKRLKLGRHKNK